MDVTLFFGVLILSLAFFIIGFLKKSSPLVLFAGILFIFLGIVSLSGIEYNSSTTITQLNSSVTSVNYLYTSWPSKLTVPLSFISFLIGIYFVWAAAANLLTGRSRMMFDDEKEE